MSNKVEKLSTSVIVLCPRKDLMYAFPRWNKNRTLHVFHQGEEIWTERAYSGDLVKFLKEFKKRVPSLGLVEEKYETPSDYYIRVEDRDYDLWNSEDKDRCRVEITSWEDNLDRHYELVGRVKAILLQKGFRLQVEKCQVTKVIEC